MALPLVYVCIECYFMMVNVSFVRLFQPFYKTGPIYDLYVVKIGCESVMVNFFVLSNRG